MLKKSQTCIALLVALLFSAMIFASPPDIPFAKETVATVSQHDSVSIDGYTQTVYVDHAVPIRTLKIEIRGEKYHGPAWREWHSDNFDRNLSHYKSRNRGPDKPPNELFTAVSNNRAREKV